MIMSATAIDVIKVSGNIICKDIIMTIKTSVVNRLFFFFFGMYLCFKIITATVRIL